MEPHTGQQPAGLNLARSWRSRTLHDLVGQPITVSLIENSLRRGLFFPVYLFAGLRGTGKTSLGRIFATALNCEQLASLQRGEGGDIPCQTCSSCRCMAAGNHPDFIEIDAASHTGVEQARQIIEEAAFLPVLGSRKVYLIDEAHMLSKASFNAFLKMLEEPPASVVFLLATTDPHKILDTVRSRCFQLFLDPVKPDDLVPHLEKICNAEAIAYEREALMLVALESKGSVRDAINLIERLRCATDKITPESFFLVLGCPADQSFISLFELIGRGDVHALFAAMQEQGLEKFEASIIWQRLIELVRALIWAHENVPFGLFQAHFAEVRRVALSFSFEELIGFLDLLFRFEAQFSKTTARHALIERFLYTCLQRVAEGGEKAATSSVPSSRPAAAAPVRQAGEASREAVVRPAQAPTQATRVPAAMSERTQAAAQSDTGLPWQQVLARLGTHGDRMLSTVLQQGEFVSCEAGVLRIRFPKKFVFYQELLVNNRPVWQPHIEAVCGAGTIMVPDFSGEAAAEQRSHAPAAPVPGPSAVTPSVALDLADGEKWPLAKKLMEVFPGKITIVEEK
ncbi:MAG: DNA polymerase III subunit gamma/tau [Candidatus Dependentiae bacterium]|nr:DNA polymerase III subunit gamma/tau [Candidatus Dependentiae bacterium]